MASDSRKDNRTKIVSLSVRYKSATVDEFIDNHAHDISPGGMFVKTPKAFVPGTLLKFEVRIAGDISVISGVGRVAWKRDAESVTPSLPPGMGVKFIKLDDESKAVIERLTAKNASVPPPTPPAFPSGSPSAPLENDARSDNFSDETVARQTRELLEQALQEAGGTFEELMNLPGMVASTSDPPMPISAADEIAKASDAAPPLSTRRPVSGMSERSSKPNLEAAAKPADRESKVPWFAIFVGAVIVATIAFATRDQWLESSASPPTPTASAAVPHAVQVPPVPG